MILQRAINDQQATKKYGLEIVENEKAVEKQRAFELANLPMFETMKRNKD